MAEEPLKLFFSYSHNDEDLRKRLESHLASLRRQGLIVPWYDRKIGAGAEWAYEIDNSLNSADIILLLVSPDFINSEYCWGTELTRAMERHECDEARVIPIILRPVDWTNTPFRKLQPFPKDAKPVFSSFWSNPDEAFLDVAQGIRAAAERLIEQRKRKLQQKESAREQYKKKVEEVLSYAKKISLIERDTLDELRQTLNLTPEEAKNIEAHAFEPYKRYEENLHKYKQTLIKVIQGEDPLGDETKERLKLRQRDLGLKPEDVERIEKLILNQAEAKPQEKLRQEEAERQQTVESSSQPTAPPQKPKTPPSASIPPTTQSSGARLQSAVTPQVGQTNTSPKKASSAPQSSRQSSPSSHSSIVSPGANRSLQWIGLGISVSAVLVVTLYLSQMQNLDNQPQPKQEQLTSSPVPLTPLPPKVEFFNQPSQLGKDENLTKSAHPSSFHNTCKNISISKNILTATCYSPNGQSRQTSIELKGIENINGELRVTDINKPSNFQDSCNNISIDKNELSASCSKPNGQSRQTSTVLNGIENINGILKYTSSP